MQEAETHASSMRRTCKQMASGSPRLSMTSETALILCAGQAASSSLHSLSSPKFFYIDDKSGISCAQEQMEAEPHRMFHVSRLKDIPQNSMTLGSLQCSVSR